MNRIEILCVPLLLLPLNDAVVWAQAVSVVPLPQEVEIHRRSFVVLLDQLNLQVS